MKRKTLYAIHRRLAAVAGLQLVLWCAGGLIFSTHAIDDVRGMTGHDATSAKPVPWSEVRVPPAALPLGDGPVEGIELRMLLDEPVYEVAGASGPPRLFSARTGEALPPVSREQAIEVARRDRQGTPAVIDAALVEADAPVEFRERRLPAWRIRLSDGQGTHIWIDAATGRVAARRNDAWRRFDFFWMLHTMDYGGRDDFNTPWLIVFSVLGLATGLSGLVVWGARLRPRRRATA